jgi:hypothetical protein
MADNFLHFKSTLIIVDAKYELGLVSSGVRLHIQFSFFLNDKCNKLELLYDIIL